MPEELYTTVRFDEVEVKIKEYSLPSDFSWDELSTELDKLREAFDDPGLLRLTYRDYGPEGPWVLLSVSRVLENGLVDARAEWETLQVNTTLDTLFDPAIVAAATAMPAPNPPPPATFNECWVDGTWSNTFAEWARDNAMGESVDFLIWLQQSYKPTPTWEWADHLMNTYVLPTAAQPLNIDGSTVAAAKQSLPMMNRHRGVPPANAFDGVEADVVALLTGVYNRFVRAQAGT